MNKWLLGARLALYILLALALVGIVHSSLSLSQANKVNAYLASPDAVEERPDHPSAILADANNFSREGDQQALELLTQLLGQTDGEIQQIARYNRGNVNLRQAFGMDEDDSQMIPLVELAKQDYRDVLKQDPAFWQARYNLELALRKVPEDPTVVEEDKAQEIHNERSIESKAFKIDLP